MYRAESSHKEMDNYKTKYSKEYKKSQKSYGNIQLKEVPPIKVAGYGEILANRPPQQKMAEHKPTLNRTVSQNELKHSRVQPLSNDLQEKMRHIVDKYRTKREGPLRVEYPPQPVQQRQKIFQPIKPAAVSLQIPRPQTRKNEWQKPGFLKQLEPLKPDKEPTSKPNNISITINFEGNVQQEKTISLSSSSTIKQLKAWYTKEVPAVNPQSMVISYQRRYLLDNQTLASCSITQDCTVTALVREPIGIGIVLPDKRTISHIIRFGDTVKSIKQYLTKFHKVQTKELSLAYNGKRLSEKATYSNINVPNGAILNLVPQKINTSIYAMAMFGNQVLNAYDNYLSSETTILQLKKLLMHHWGIPVNMQLLTSSTAGGAPVQDKMTIGEAAAKDDCVLNLVMDLTKYRPITIRNTANKDINLIAFPTNTLRELVNSVEKPQANFELYLIFEQKELDLNLKFFDCPIPTFDVLKLHKRANITNVSLNCKTLTGQATIVSIQPTQTILNVKKKIFQISNYPVSLQILKLNEVELQDSKRVSDCNLKNNSEINIRLRLRPG